MATSQCREFVIKIRQISFLSNKKQVEILFEKGYLFSYFFNSFLFLGKKQQFVFNPF